MKKAEMVLLVLGAALVCRAEVKVREKDVQGRGAVRYVEEMVPMKDGVKLYTYCAAPAAGEKRAIVLYRNPYTALNKEVDVPAYAVGQKGTMDRGYVVIQQHCRGCGASEGDMNPYQNERADGLATLEWLRTLPFYNGEIFLAGMSYLSTVHLLYIDTNPPDVKGAVLEVQDCNRYNVLYRNGFFKNALHGGWFLGEYMKKNQNLTRNRGVGFNDFPLCDFSRRYYGFPVKYLDEPIAHPREDDPFWQTVAGGHDSYNAVTKAKFPILLTTRWYDIYTGGIFDMWNRIPAAQRAHCAMLVGAYDHGGSYNPKNSSTPVPFRKGTQGEVCPDLPFQWFDHIRKGAPLTFVKEGQIGYFALYENEWHFTPQLENGPVAHTFYLNKKLLGEKPVEGGEITYTYDPKNLASFPGGLCLNFGGMPIQPPPDFRPDVISFLSEPLPAMLDVRGRMKARLVCKSDCEDTCFYIRVSVVKGGVAFPLRDDITSLCYATPDYTPGTEKAVEFTFSDHAFRVSPGDLLRVDVSSSAGNLFAPHTNCKGLQSVQRTCKIAHNTIVCGKSSLTLFAQQ